MSRTYAISGATSMIGRALVQRLLLGGERVIALVRPDGTPWAGLPWHRGLTVLPCALSEYEKCLPDASADVFVHLAWAGTTGELREDAEVQQKNIKYTLDAVRFAHRLGCNVFVGAGSQAECGRVEHPLRGDMPVNPQSGYGLAKYAAGRLSRLLCRELGIRHCWARILSVYGEGDRPDSFVMYLIRTLAKGEVPRLTPCEQIWDYLYVGDAAEALCAIAERGKDGATYPLGSGHGRPLCDYACAIRDEVAPTIGLDFGARPYPPHQPMYLLADITALTEDTGFVPRVPFRAGIRRVLETIDKRGESNERTAQIDQHPGSDL